MKTIIPLCAVLMFSGCATYDMTRDAVRAKAAEGYDRLLAAASRVKCEDISIGAWRRKYGHSPALAAAWRVECDSAGEELPMIPTN